MARKEEKLHIAVCDYLKLQYPNIIFLSEASGVRVSMGLASKLKKMRSAHTHLDLYVLEPKGRYCGLILELKVESVYKKDGGLYSNQHLRDQRDTIEKLNKKGYKADFACSFDEAKKMIDSYLK